MKADDHSIQGEVDTEISPASAGEEDVSGSATDPESDDNMLDASHEVGLRMNETEDEKQELNIAQDVEEAEKARRGPD